MKRLLFLFIVLFFAGFGSYSQYYIEKYGYYIPYSLSPDYESQIDLNSIAPGVTLAPMDNDSIYQAEKPWLIAENPEVSPSYTIQIDTALVLKDIACKIEIDEGTLWILKIKSTTAMQLGVIIKKTQIPEGAGICYHVGVDDDFYVPFCYTSDRFFTVGRGYVNDDSPGDAFYVEYFEPKNTKEPGNPIIEKIIYGYASPKGEVKVLKSGSFHGC